MKTFIGQRVRLANTTDVPVEMRGLIGEVISKRSNSNIVTVKFDDGSKAMASGLVLVKV